jgi:hypothetical protein
VAERSATVGLTRKVILGFLGLSLVIIALVFAGYYLVIIKLYGTPQSASELGDSFGAVSAVLSALGIAGVLAALLLQTMELSLQSSELRRQRRDLDRTVRVQEEQREAMFDIARAQVSTAQLNAVAPLMQVAYERFERRGRDHEQARRRLAEFRQLHEAQFESYAPTKQEQIKDQERALTVPAGDARRELEDAERTLAELEERARAFIRDADELLAPREPAS